MIMKKLNLLLAFCLIATLISCASMPQPASYDTDIKYETDNPVVTLVVTPSWSNNLLYGSGFYGFNCSFKNNTEKVVRIVWDQSSINYNGNSYVPFIDGQKYINAQDPMSPTAIAKGGSLSKDVFSSNQPHYTSGQYGGWSMLPINANEVELIICVKSEEKEEFITAKISAVMNATN
jgi:hypothetical protein